MAGQLLLSAADTYSTTRPTITLFNTVQHGADTELRETFEIPFDNSKTFFGSRSTCTIPKRSDILTGVTLRAILPPIYPVQSDQYVYPTPSSQVDGTVYADMTLTQVVADGVTLTANTAGNHYFSVGAQVTLTGTKYLIFNLDGTYTIASIPTADSFTCSATLAGVSYNGTASVPGIVPSDVVGYFSTTNFNLWLNNLTNKTWAITGISGSTITTSTASKFPVGSQVLINLPNAGYLNSAVTVSASTDFTFNIPVPTVNKYVAVDGPPIYSTDVTTWTEAANTIGTNGYTSITSGNNLFVAVGQDSSMYSYDGNTWLAGTAQTGNWTGVAYGNGVFVAVGNIIMYSINGTTWTYVPIQPTGGWAGVAYGNGWFVAIAGGPSNGVVAKSSNGIDWTQISGVPGGTWKAVAYGNGYFVAVEETVSFFASQAMYSSTNGSTWAAVSIPRTGFDGYNGIAYGNGVFAAIGRDCSAYSTTNGATWVPSENPTGQWKSVTYGFDRFVAVGLYGKIGYSLNGSAWITVPLSFGLSTGSWTSVTYGVAMASLPTSSSDSVSLPVPPLTVSLPFAFSSSNYPSISFRSADDASFWGFDARQGLTYALPATPPWTLTQSGWISGFLPPNQSSWTDSVAHKLCKSVRIMCGKQTIKEYTGEYLELKNDLTVPYENKAVLKLLNGTLDQTQATVAREYYVPLPLGTKEIPLCALTRQQMSIDIDFEEYVNLSSNLNPGTGDFLDSKSYVSTSTSLGVQATLSYQTYIFIMTYSGNILVYDGTNYITAITGSPGTFSRFCILGNTLYIQQTNGYILSGLVSELVKGNASSVSRNSYLPVVSSDIGAPTGTMVVDNRYLYYAQCNVASNVLMVRYDTQSPFGYKSFNFTSNVAGFGSNVTSVNQVISTGSQLVMIPNIPRVLYTYQLNSDFLVQWYTTDYTNYGCQISEGVLIGNSIYFIIDGFNILKYTNGTFILYLNFYKRFVVNHLLFPSLYSANGLVWNKVYINTTISDPSWSCLAYGNGRFASLSMAGNYGKYSSDGMVWTLSTGVQVGFWQGMAFGNGVFVAVGDTAGYGPGLVETTPAYSTNGDTWVYATSTQSGNWKAVSYGGGVFVAVSYDNKSMYSLNNGMNWSLGTVPASVGVLWYSVTYGNGRFVAVGPTNIAMYSIDNGQNWVLVSCQLSTTWYSVTFGAGRFVAVGTGGDTPIMYSLDGQTWYPSNYILIPGAVFYTNWNSVTFVDGIFYASAKDNNTFPTNTAVMYSTDGITWLKAQDILYNGPTSPIGIITGTSNVITINGSSLGSGFKNLTVVGSQIYASSNSATVSSVVQIDTTKNLSTAAAYKYYSSNSPSSPINFGGTAPKIFGNDPRYLYIFTQDSVTSRNVIRFDPYPPITTLQASILVDYKSSKTKPTTASLRIVQSQKVTTMDNLDIRCPVKELWLMGATNGYQYSNLAAQCSLLINNEPLLTLDVGTQKYLKTIQPFETHTSMPIRNFSVLSFEFNPESPKPNGTINFSRINEQEFTGGATHAWASTYNILVIKDGVGGLMFNF